MDRVKNLREKFEKAFTEPLNATQLWAITLLAKHVRLRARNNSAFNNFMNAMFPHAQFRTVQKKRISYKTKLEETYPGLTIVVNNVAVDDDEGEEE